jgi:hypothetical protein
VRDAALLLCGHRRLSLTFDGLEGREFRSARDAERAVRTLLQQRRHLLTSPSLASAF